jgi:hypothetical protein
MTRWRRRIVSLSAVVATITTLSAPSARADPAHPEPPRAPQKTQPPAPDPRAPSARPLSMRVDGGLGAPTGIIGISVGYIVHPLFALEASVGFGVSGIQNGFMAKLCAPLSTSSILSLGAGPSLGTDISSHSEAGDYRGIILWLHGEAGYEYRFQDGFSLFVGAGAVYNALRRRPPLPNPQIASWDSPGTLLPSYRIGMGGAF